MEHKQRTNHGYREDARNKNGGAWTFRISKERSHEFWKEVLMMAIGEILQEVVEKGEALLP